MKRIAVLLAFVGLAFTTFAQKGTIRGTVFEDATGEPMIGVSVVIKGTTIGGVSDFDGKFQIQVAPGAYDVQASFVSYETVTITGIEVKEGEANVLDQIRMREAVSELQEVVITAEVLKTNEAALLTVKKKSANLMDGISAANFRKIGDSDAAGAVKRVTGVSVEGGKYVYVRGLGDRYTKTMLNSMDIPGLDPDRNSLQIDIFPTNLIDNMVVLKSGLAEMPADFTGGVVDIETKDFPEEKILDVSFGMEYNPSMHFNKDYVTYEGGNTDWLGFDDGARDLPNGAKNYVPAPGIDSDQDVYNFTKQMSPDLGAENKTSPMNYSLGLTFGNQKELKNGNSLGYIFSATYKRKTEFYDNIIYGEYQKPQGAEDTELITATIRQGSQGSENVLLGGLGGLAYKTQNSKYRLTVMHLQNGESTAARLNILDDPDDKAYGKSGYTAYSDNLAYYQRGMTNLLLNGEHHINNDDWVIGWKISPTFSSLKDPDIRVSPFSYSQGQPGIAAGQGGMPSRTWRYLDEVNVSNRIDVTRNLTLFGADAKFKAGLNYVYKERDYEILNYQLAFFGSQPELSGDPNELLYDENIYPNAGNVYYQSGNQKPNPNEYNSNVNNIAGYVSAEFSLFPKLKTVWGLRAENYVQRHTGRDLEYAQSGVNGNNLDNTKVLDELKLFPSANLIYSLTEEQNLRFSYARTIARPSFKELSYAQIIDPISNRIFNGGFFKYSNWDGNLHSTLIDNFDLRWEMFLPKGQLISLSGFYKSFDAPIELVRISTVYTSSEFQPRNVGSAKVYGLELEFRKSLDFISPALSKFKFNGNITYTKSLLDMTEMEYNARKAYEKTGENIDDQRDMAGQAPYVVNAGIAYENIEKAFEAGLYYNVQGETLVAVGGGLFPDVYSEPFNSLNFNVNKKFGKEDKLSLNLSVENILNDDREEFYHGYHAADQYFTKKSPGTTFGVGVGYSF